jgi:hypothetical protein
MADQDVVAAARELKQAHMRADLLGGDHSADVARAYSRLLDAVGDVDEPEEVTARTAELAAERAAIAAAQTPQAITVSIGQDQSASLETEGPAQP